MKFNILKQKLPFILLCAIAATNINISSTAKADAMVNSKTTKQVETTIIGRITQAIKNLFTTKKVATAKADAMVNHKTTKQTDMILANTIIDKITEATKDILKAKTAKAVEIKKFLNGIKPCGPVSTMVLQNLKKDWAEFVSVLAKTNQYRGAQLFTYIKNNLEPSMKKLGNQLVILADKIRAIGPQFNHFVFKLKMIPVNLKKTGGRLGIMRKLSIANCLQRTRTW